MEVKWTGAARNELNRAADADYSRITSLVDEISHGDAEDGQEIVFGSKSVWFIEWKVDRNRDELTIVILQRLPQ